MTPHYWTTPGGAYPLLCADILQQPHTLIAGTTGSGKSVLMADIIHTALCFSNPDQRRFVLIDTKKTELYRWRDVPHTARYCDTPAEAARLFDWLAIIIDQRNDRTRRAGLTMSAECDIYVIIDELGDLVTSEPRTVKQLAHVAMIGRSARVHLIAGTQCPNRKTLSAEFAANCPARVGLRCRDAVESRQIIGTADCVGLPLYGQAYYLTPKHYAPELVAVPYTAPADIAARVKWWTDQRPRRHWWQR